MTLKADTRDHVRFAAQMMFDALVKINEDLGRPDGWLEEQCSYMESYLDGLGMSCDPDDNYFCADLGITTGPSHEVRDYGWVLYPGPTAS